MGGDGDTPFAASYSAAEPFTVVGASVARYVFDTGDWDNSGWIVPLGASGHPGSPHYEDQTALWADARLIPMLYDWARIAAESESTQRLKSMD
jgi:penicillin amidase